MGWLSWWEHITTVDETSHAAKHKSVGLTSIPLLVCGLSKVMSKLRLSTPCTAIVTAQDLDPEAFGLTASLKWHWENFLTPPLSCWLECHQSGFYSFLASGLHILIARTRYGTKSNLTEEEFIYLTVWGGKRASLGEALERELTHELVTCSGEAESHEWRCPAGFLLLIQPST